MIDLMLGLWIVATLALYRALEGRTATLVAMIGGWALLPNQVISERAMLAGEKSNAIHALAIPSPPILDKASAIGLGCLLGSILFDWRNFRRGGRPRWPDAPMIAWCLAPAASALANGVPLPEGLAQSRHLALAWGVPYAIGRSSFASAPALLQYARAWTLAGLATLVPALIEFARGPILYHLAYGFHPYRFSGSDRTLGHRPVLFFESGNQFGIWAASAAVASAWLWATGHRVPLRIGKWAIPASFVPLVLIGSCFLWQSHSAIVFLLLGLAPLSFRGRLGTAGRRLIQVGLILIGVAVLGAGIWIAAKSGGNPREATRTLFHGIGKASFTWRLARIADDFPQILRHPLLGWCRPDWSGRRPDGTFEDPIAISVWIHAAGMYGAVGWASCIGACLVPLLAAVNRLRRLDWGRAEWGGISASTAILAVNVADLSMNSILILPVLIASGGLASWGLGMPGSVEGVHPDERGSRTYSVPGFKTHA
ncbi:hypothetical protein TA3x_003292 [Tundrisphaera sp. TA3]|uniref:hypothetical protein n=1 Tax=Tundrisphaera sp. TA3 TaxID=3435775 RepID=UPI003EB871A2